jgi:hypothetical protein
MSCNRSLPSAIKKAKELSQPPVVNNGVIEREGVARGEAE